MLKPSLQLRIGQQLTMTPQLQQAIRLLQLPSLDLQAHVRETLETNVMLEAEDELPLEVPGEGVREEAAPPVEEKYAELDGNAVPTEEPSHSEVEIADESWGEQAAGPSDSPWSGDDETAVPSASASIPLARRKYRSTPGSRSPVRVAIGMPPVGVSPMLVSTD